MVETCVRKLVFVQAVHESGVSYTTTTWTDKLLLLSECPRIAGLIHPDSLDNETEKAVKVSTNHGSHTPWKL